MNALSFRTTLVPYAIALVVALATLLSVQRSRGDDGPPPVSVIDAGLVQPTSAASTTIDPPAVPAASEQPKQPAPTSSPSEAIDGFRLWLKQGGWTQAVLFAIACLLVAASANVKRLRTGKAAILVGTALAAIVTVLGAMAAGLTNAQAVAGALYVAMGGVMWAVFPNRATVDLSTATPQQIAAALAAADKPPAFPVTGPSA